MSNLPEVNIANLLDAGVHFGHKASRWNPKMAPYIYGVRDNLHIIDLQQTVPLMKIALHQIYKTVKNNGKVLFVSSKVQATDLIAEYSEKCGQFYINNRWLGGTLTNWTTISKSIQKIDEIEQMLDNEDTSITTYTKKERLELNKKRTKLLKSFAGIRKIAGKPDLLIVIDTNKEHLAITEAAKLNIPVIAVVDSNSNPDNVNYPIPGNDDAIRSIRLYCHLFAEAALAGIQDALNDSSVNEVNNNLAKNIEDSNSMDAVKQSEKGRKVKDIYKRSVKKDEVIKDDKKKISKKRHYNSRNKEEI
jgi:small subunit ribosomal protein S2